MRLKRIALLLLAASLLFASCASKDSAADPKAVSITSMEGVPPLEEYSNLPMSERLRVKMGIEDIPIASCSAHYDSLIQDFLAENEMVSLRGTRVERDDLSVVRGENRKSLLDLVLYVDLEMDAAHNLEACDIAKELPAQILECLHQDTFSLLKVKEWVVSVYDLTGYLVWSSGGTAHVSGETIFREQSEEEHAAQTVAYGYSRKNGEFVLNKFGAIPETEELYVEYYVEDSYFGRGEETNRAAIEDLERISSEIKDWLLKEDPVGSYITGNDLKNLTLSFRNGIFDESCQVFHFEL